MDDIAQKLGASPDEMVPFAKYARAAEGLLKPSSAARAVESGSGTIERVDRLVQQIGRALGVEHPVIDATVTTVDRRLEQNRLAAA